jgi:hypothetical protein
VIAVAREGGLTAVFPGDRAVFHGAASAAALDALFGVPLTPPEVMDLLVGAAPPRLRSHDVRWGPELPRDVRATLEDGTRLSVEIEDAEGGPPLPEAAFEAPPSEGYRVVDASEARDLLAER